MRREFYDIYDDLIDAYGRGFPQELLTFRWPANSLRLSRNVRRGIDAGLHRTPNGLRLRPDARLFLLVNFNELVAKPLAHPQAFGPDGPSDLEEMIASDTQSIVDAAANTAEPEITSRSVLGSITPVYERLRIRGLDLWG